MCGIIGYVGKKQVTPILLEGLRRMEYRGYEEQIRRAVRDAVNRPSRKSFHCLRNGLFQQSPNGTLRPAQDQRVSVATGSAGSSA